MPKGMYIGTLSGYPPWFAGWPNNRILDFIEDTTNRPLQVTGIEGFAYAAF